MKNPPKIKLEYVSNAPNSKPFINVKREKYKLHYPDASEASMVLNYIERVAADAVAILAFNSSKEVWFRSCFRPAAGIRFSKQLDFQYDGNLWEMPAGLIDSGETPEQAVVREGMEEIGFQIPIENLKLLHIALTLPSLMAEKLYFYAAPVENLEQLEPTLDNSPLERGGELMKLHIDEAMELNNAGKFPDMKTNLGLRLLNDYLKNK